MIKFTIHCLGGAGSLIFSMLLILSILINAGLLFSTAAAGAVATIAVGLGVETVVGNLQRELSEKAGLLSNERSAHARTRGELDRETKVRKRAQAKLKTITIERDRLHRETQKLEQKLTQRRNRVRNVATRINRRTALGAGRNVASMVAEGIPIYGVAVIVAVTTMEISDACSTMKDMDQLARSFDLNPSIEDVKTVCGIEIPTAGELWQRIQESPGTVIDDLKRRYDEIELPEPPSFDSFWQSIVAFAEKWLPNPF